MRVRTRHGAPVGSGLARGSGPPVVAGLTLTSRLAAAVLAAIATAAMAGCASSTATPGSAQNRLPSVATPSLAQAQAQVLAKPCAPAGVSISAGHSGAATGHIALTLTFTNTGSASCYVQGYPTVTAVLARGELKAAQTSTGYAFPELPGNEPPRVTLKPNASAVAILEWEDLTGVANVAGAGAHDGGSGTSTSTCPAGGATALLVTAPGATSTATPTRLTGVATDVCAGFEVHPVIPASEAN